MGINELGIELTVKMKDFLSKTDVAGGHNDIILTVRQTNAHKMVVRIVVQWGAIYVMFLNEMLE